MSVRSTQDIIEAIRERLGDDQSDAALALLEDVTDTLADKDALSADGAIWKTKYEENDASWRKKYRDRFFAPSDPDDAPQPIETKPADTEPLTFEKLFTTEVK